jgi:hypothetical protein
MPDDDPAAGSKGSKSAPYANNPRGVTAQSIDHKPSFWRGGHTSTAGSAPTSTPPTCSVPTPRGTAGIGVSKKLVELLYGKTSLSDDPSNGSGLQVSAGVARNRDGARRVSRIFQDVMASDDSIHHKSRSHKRTDDALSADYRQSRGCHITRPR